MSGTETIADIANEIRGYFDLLKRGLIPDNIARMTTRQRHQFWADRIESAGKRERAALDGDGAAMRTALEKIAASDPTKTGLREPIDGDSCAIYENSVYDKKGGFQGKEIPSWWGAVWYDNLKSAASTARSALEAPARRCDIMRDANIAAAIYEDESEIGLEHDVDAFAKWFTSPASPQDKPKSCPS